MKSVEIAKQLKKLLEEREAVFKDYSCKIEAIKALCKHSKTVILYGPYKDTYGWPDDDASHDGCVMCLVCGMEKGYKYGAVPPLSPMARLEVHHYLYGSCPPYHKGREEEKEYDLVKRLFGYSTLLVPLKDKLAYVKKKGYRV